MKIGHQFSKPTTITLLTRDYPDNQLKGISSVSDISLWSSSINSYYLKILGIPWQFSQTKTVQNVPKQKQEV